MAVARRVGNRITVQESSFAGARFEKDTEKFGVHLFAGCSSVDLLGCFYCTY